MASKDIAVGLLIGGTLVWFQLLPLRLQRGKLAGPDPALRRAIVAASVGVWKPAAELLAGAAQDWERRALYVGNLASLTGWMGGRWLRAWDAARPGDPDVALVKARARIHRAWKKRGAAYAHRTSAWRIRAFHRELLASREEIAVAASLSPDDPTPHSAEILTALGLGYSHDLMSELWAEVTARSPHHFEAHFNALQYWSAKWRGSNELACAFAQQASTGAPKGSLMAALPLFAWYEAYFSRSDLLPGPRSPEVRVMIDATLEDVNAADDHPRLSDVRHLLAYCLHKQGRHREALEQFRHVDGYVDALPWHYTGYRRIYYRAIRTAAARGALIESLRR
ncbi:hypothetical protein [Streptomyces sp. NPDC005262]|uniref:hypothetical protein n=1 Tax=Streptomyces sp. NPDC005262 TaxID=3364710 RepID=UPI0036CE1B99